MPRPSSKIMQTNAAPAALAEAVKPKAAVVQDDVPAANDTPVAKPVKQTREEKAAAKAAEKAAAAAAKEARKAALIDIEGQRKLAREPLTALEDELAKMNKANEDALKAHLKIVKAFEAAALKYGKDREKLQAKIDKFAAVFAKTSEKLDAAKAKLG